MSQRLLMAEIESWMEHALDCFERSQGPPLNPSVGKALLLRLRALRASQSRHRQLERRQAMATLRAEVMERAQGRCEFCGAVQTLQLHHLLGGHGRRREQQAAWNCAAVCHDCHGTWHREPGSRGEFIRAFEQRTGGHVP